MTLHHHVSGHCLGIAATTERGAPWRVRTYPAGWTLIGHPTVGRLLFDTGYAPRVRRAMARWPGALYGLVTPVRLNPGEEAVAQLARRGLGADDIAGVIVSHLHADHVGGLLDFPHARLSLDARAWQHTRAWRGVAAVRRGVLRDLLPDDLEARAGWLDFRAAPPGLTDFGEAADVCGDGSVWAVPVPGHAPGMIAVICRTAPDAALTGSGHGLSVLAADTAWSARALRAGAAAPAVGRLAHWNAAQEARSARTLRAWLAGHPHAALVLSHDPPQWAVGVGA
ncbi:MBL fold metallo-hydrolase [Deinococcus sp.]|uniref:MBL fold metallo-hydrolase n=1 Tax=Deinococcus sp. TaxID=47478 RepID=UPI0028698D3B|nr:MBL fold metallo-hydrolase [Deinococcus sp.]